ncbi:hypothetical protein WA026_018306 [Henosepilachna vigintioctopunctata]|uniref:Uncharacterized protein n=1 Tax=Henosepilachna vigintioctopunctata TaxID=420089 RepID=A0AAW1VA95_9CUCU
MLIIFVLYFTCFRLGEAIFNPSNETDLSRCKVHYSRSGAAYKDYYELSKPKSNDTDLRLDFHFSVLAMSDAHILLAPSRATQKTDPAYEIVIGAGGNTFCDIRRMQKSQVKESIRVKGLLSAVDIRSFWIHMTKDGELALGREGEDLPFIAWKDPDPLPLSVISFSTWPGIEAKWFFDCIKNDIKRIKRNLTQIERLRKDLLTNYDPYSRPVKNHSDITFVQLAPKIRGLSLDEDRSILEVHGIAKIGWYDEKLIWNESDYGGIDKIMVSTDEIWKPNIILFNSVKQDFSIYDNTLLTVKNTGEVTWIPILDLNSWCGSDDYGKWPKDTRKCDLLFTFWTDFTYLQLEYPNDSYPLFKHQYSQWTIEEVEVILNYGRENETSADEMSGMTNLTGPPLLNICLTLKRDSWMYSLIFFTPYLMIAVSMLSTFCVSPFGPAKISLGCFQLILSTACLIFLGKYLPAHSFMVPYIVQLYSYSVIGGCVTIIVSVYVINLSRKERKRLWPSILSSILTHPIVKITFCLPEVKRDEYGKLTTMTRITDPQQYYILLGILIDRIFLDIGIALFIYSVYLY